MSPDVNEAGFYHYGITMALENRHPNHIYPAFTG
jgi:hypothetical protein